SQAVPSTNKESMLPRESTNAELMIAVVGGDITSAGAEGTGTSQVTNFEDMIGPMIAVAGGDMTSAGVEGAGTSQVPNTKDMIGPVSGGSQAMPSTKNESMLPRESTNAEQMIAVAGGESSGHNAASVLCILM
ncbi:hypothetical protein HAX54_046460, partial [Datura stramonium]|nr:hypothetical protein [Datura stramonium]